MWRETFILSLIVFIGIVRGNDDDDALRTFSVGSDPSSTILNEFDLHYYNDQEFQDDTTFEEMETDDVDDPYYFLPLDDQDSPILVPSTPSTTRQLSGASAKIGTFYPLDCNPTSWSCTSFGPGDLPTGSNPLVIPCGQCYRFDITGNVTLNGLDIKGKLLFPVNQKVNIFTPYVIVQGELELNVDHDKVSPDNLATRFILTGTDAVSFTPSEEPNVNVCEQTNNICKLGVKPFLVAGGKVNINSIPETCATHTPIKKKIYKDPVYNPENFTEYITFPSSCPQSGINFVSNDFEDNDYGNWTGREGAFVVMADGTMKITNRRLRNRGPVIDITPLDPANCLVSDQKYLFVSR